MKLAALLFFLSVSAQAAMPNSRKLSCADAIALVQQNGAIVFTTKPGIFDRYVAGRQFCERGENLSRASVPTLDNESCPVGYVCH